MKTTLSLTALSLLLGLAGCDQKGVLKVGEVEPNQGITGGGDTVTIAGGGFEPGKTQVEVRFGRSRAEQVSIASAGKIIVVTPPGEKGPVDVTLMFDSGQQFKIPGGFRYVPPTTGDDVRKAFFSGKPTAPGSGGTNTATKPPEPPK